MAQYLVAIYLPDDFDPSSADKSMEHDIDVLNEEMEAKGARPFAGGLRPARDAKAMRVQRHGKVLITDGPYLETKEHVGGFWILEVADMDEALAWARKAVVACRAPVEVRSFFRSDPTGLLARRPLKEGMTQYLATIFLPDNFDPSAPGQRDGKRHRRAHQGDGGFWCQGGFRWRPEPGERCEVAASAARWQGAYHRRAIPGDQGAHRRSFDRGSR
jgi:hypothetical protein